MPTKHNFSNTIITLVLVTFTTFSLNFAGIINIGRVEYPTILGHNLAWDRYPIEGFAWPSSVKQGENLKLYVSVRNIADTTEQSSGNRNYSINIFRLPDQNTVYWSSANIPGQFFPLHDVNDSSIYPGDYSRKPIEFKKGCMAYWENGAITVSIGSGWPSGLYYAKLRHLSDTTKDFFVPFVVRSANPGTTSKILFKFDFNTFMAYSHFGGGSLYSDKDTLSLTFTDTIATDRPIIGSIDTTRITWKDYKDNYKIFIASLDSLGYEMEYCNNIDIDKNPIENGKEFVANYNMMVIFWHDEYWSQDERTNTEKFKGTNPNGSPSGLHGNIARFAPNTCYWRIHWDTLNGQKNYKKLWCRKSNWPGHHPYDLWRDTQYGPGLPEAKLLGEQFESAWTKGGHEPPDTVYKENHWIFKRTNLYNGDAFGYGWIWDTLRLGIVLGELENTRTGKADFPLDTLAQSWVLGANGLLDLKQMLYYEDTSSNARVFAEGANGWVNGLHPNADHDTDVVRMKKITDNIFSHFSGKKYIGNVYTTFENALKWKTPIELDGNVTILQNKYLRIDTTTITIDSNTHCFIDGKMEINGNVTINGQDNLSSLNVNPTGQLILKANSTLTINNPAVLVMEAGGDVVFEANAKLILNSAVLENGAMLSVESGGTLEIATSEIGFGGAGSSIVSTGGAININEGVTLIVNNGGVFGCLQAGNIQLGENASIVVAEDGNLVWNGNGTWQFGNNSHLEIYGTADVSDNVVLNFPSSSDVTVYEDAQFIMRVNSQINVDGKFVVSGSAERHVTFTLNGRPEELWQGFSFGVETHQSIIDYADITNAEKGISTPYNIDLKITNTTFTNGQIGIYLYTSDKDPAVYGPVYVGNNFISGENVAGIYVDKGSSDVVIKDNTIEGMADWGAGMNFAFSSPQQLTGNKVSRFEMGIYCSNASPGFVVNEEEGGNNCFYDNQYGVFAEYESNPMLGSYEYRLPGFNSIKDNSVYLIVLRENCNNVYAEQNFFHEGEIDPERDFLVDETSSLFYGFYLETDPNQCGGSKATFASQLLDETEGRNDGSVSHSLSFTDPRIKLAIQKRLQKDFTAAMGILKALINTETDVALVRWALNELLTNFQMLRNPNGTNVLSGYLRGRLQSTTNDEIKRAIRDVLSGTLLHERKPDEVLQALNESIQLYPNTSSELLALYGRVSLALNTLNDISLAQSTAQALQTKYPNERLTKLAEKLVQISTSISSKQTVNEQENQQANKPSEYFLEQNFPNPFNPITEIRFDLPEEVFTTLKIYDVLGREVATLVKGIETAGFKTVRFDASSLNSGIYFYKLTAGAYVSVKKLAVMK